MHFSLISTADTAWKVGGFRGICLPALRPATFGLGRANPVVPAAAISHLRLQLHSDNSNNIINCMQNI